MNKTENLSEQILSSVQRRENSNTKIKKLGIACFEQLPLLPDSSQVKIRDIDQICSRAVACLLSTQLACDLANSENSKQSTELFSKLLTNFGVENELIAKEKRLFDNKYSQQDIVDVIWTYEAYWSLVWALGLVDDIEIPDDICDCHTAVHLVADCKNYDTFKESCSLRDTDQILDMLDLYYRYHWACEDKRLKPDTNIGSLNPEVVVERRRGLEWLISEETDWNDISLDT
ncbi:MAG: DUF4272 domain-containing protein [Oscillospiraceae bacterium]|nr:DUF4272 domain-containing protein [Oscillospiraceae bacterium]